jgi:choline transport protein
LSLINIGSTVAFNAIGSLAVSAILGTYIISFTVLILRRLRGGPLPARRWTLGRYGIFINIGAVLFLLVVWVFVFFPLQTPVTPSTMNWNGLFSKNAPEAHTNLRTVVMFGGTMIFAVVYYIFVGKNTYTAPVELVKRNL